MSHPRAPKVDAEVNAAGCPAQQHETSYEPEHYVIVVSGSVAIEEVVKVSADVGHYYTIGQKIQCR